MGERAVWRWWVDRLNVCWVWVHYVDKSNKKIKITWNVTHFLVNILFPFCFLFPLMHFKSYIQWSLKCLLMWWLRKTPHVCGIPAEKAEPDRGNIRLTQAENQSIRLLVQTYPKCQRHKWKRQWKTNRFRLVEMRHGYQTERMILDFILG